MFKIMFMGKLAEVVSEVQNFAKAFELAKINVTSTEPGESPEAILARKEKRLKNLREIHTKIQTQKIGGDQPAQEITLKGVPQSGPCPNCGVQFERLRKHYPNCKGTMFPDQDETVEEDQGALPIGSPRPTMLGFGGRR